MDVEPRHATADPLAESALLLLDVGKSFGTVLDLAELLNKVLDAAIALTHTSEGGVFLLSPDNGKLTKHSARPPIITRASHLDRTLDELIASIVVSLGASVMLESGDHLPQ